MSRRSYRELMAHVAWGLYRGDELIATVRAATRDDAWDIFVKHHAIPRFECPRCERVSANVLDAAEGYCGSCHDWTGAALIVRKVKTHVSPADT